MRQLLMRTDNQLSTRMIEEEINLDKESVRNISLKKHQKIDLSTEV